MRALHSNLEGTVVPGMEEVFFVRLVSSPLLIAGPGD